MSVEDDLYIYKQNFREAQRDRDKWKALVVAYTHALDAIPMFYGNGDEVKDIEDKASLWTNARAEISEARELIETLASCKPCTPDDPEGCAFQHKAGCPVIKARKFIGAWYG